MRYDAVLFDLFRTVILYTPAAPTAKVHEPQWRGAMAVLRPRATELLPGVEFDRFLDALVEASGEVRRARAPKYFEVPIADRYRRAIEILGIHGEKAARIGLELSELQLEAQAANSTLPDPHRELLESLRGRLRVAAVSNFDDSRTMHSLLARLGLDRLFSTAVISIDFGRRKPHPSIFQEALRRIDAVPQRTLFVGDSINEDIGGALAVGMDAAWVDRKGLGAKEGGPVPTYVIRELGEVAGILGC
jgi:putative hydrolase of the HAD superfamily